MDFNDDMTPTLIKFTDFPMYALEFKTQRFKNNIGPQRSGLLLAKQNVSTQQLFTFQLITA
jgi:hypothetical protein